jgi:hypothetical protein
LEILVIIILLTSANCGRCPKSDLLKPCVCNNEVISCGGKDAIQLKAIFHSISSQLGNEEEKHFKQFYLNNTAISELPEDTFEDITFDSIQIEEAFNLSLINTFAFNATNQRLKEFYIHNSLLRNFPPNYDIFTALSLMVGIETIRITNSQIEEIPENAFRPLLGQQKNLTHIEFLNNAIKKIGNNAFQYLQLLDSLHLNYNPINHISRLAFNFLEKSTNSFFLAFYSSTLNSSTFEFGSLDNLKRPTEIDLRFTGVKYLHQNIFENFFSFNNENSIYTNTLDCEDCRSFWLFNNKKYRSQLTDVECSNGNKFYQSGNFGKCVE